MKTLLKFHINSLTTRSKALMFGRLTFVLIMLFSFSFSFAQEEKKEIKPVRNMFESVWLIDNQTVIVPVKGTFEMDMLHRFGVVKNGYDDFFGIFAPGNIKLGFSYVPINNLQLGFGFTKQNLTWDFSAKYAIFQQSVEGGWPISVTYFVNAAIDTRKKDNFLNASDRFSYFHELMIARKVTKDFSVQVSGNLSHFNAVEGYITSELEIDGRMKNDHYAISALGRYKITSVMGVIAGYNQPLTQHPTNNPNPNISFGVEFVTSSHAFQIFMSNYYNIIPQRNNVLNQNNYQDGEFLIGFNITRLWNL